MSIHARVSEIAEKDDCREQKVLILPAHMPIEILRYILEIAASLDRKITARAIVLSSKLLRSWIDPILYRSIILHSIKSGAAFTASIKARRERETAFFERRVKLLAISSDVLADDIAFAVGVCTGVSTLHICILHTEAMEEPTFDTSALEHVRRFSCNFLDSGQIPLLPKSMTHLVITLSGKEEALDMDWQMLFRNCSGLTHLLIISSAGTSDEMKAFLEDGGTADIARTVFRARTQASVPLTLVFVPKALLVISIIHFPVEWIDEWRTIEDLGRFLIVRPRRLLDAIPEEECSRALDLVAEPHRVDILAVESDDSFRTCYFMNHFPGIHSDLWDFVEYAQRAPLPSSSDA